MARQTANDFHPEALKKFDEYVHGDISRREFLSSVPKYALLGLTAEALLDALNPRFAQAQQVAGNDPRIKTSYLEYPSPQGNGKVRGYLAQPANAKGKLPVVLVIHENRGLNPHIEDIARRLALDNFIAFAPDALFTLGGYPGDEDKARELFQKLEKAKTQNDFLAAAQALKKLPGGNGKLGAVGFCYGGGIVNFLATRLPDLAAGVPFYGAQPPAEDVAKIKAALLIHYAGVDDRINAGWPAFEAALQKAGTNYEAHTYAGVQHGFNNDTTPRYDAGTAKLAWDRTVAFFNAYLRDS
ncbi:dienelactone hydrolase family protein [Methylomonas sp. MS20]|uniref:dienelactone hydrolase family protein n=1 Tax=unclassified Methylomonas TaxID=2608980 RepID=UPI0028A43576|nr:dienelactone hydrolase family protein [Methylomonas sp. MV1]MDT4328706.1 dienelactone hydrolase family protein [Methylomonas sp. MV1]